MRKLLASAAIALLATSCALFDRSAPTVLSGTVTEYPSGRPLAGATVQVGEGKAIRTDAQGRFSLDGLGASASVRFSAPGYARAARVFSLLPGEKRLVDVPLPREGTPLAPNLIVFERGGRIWGVDGLGSDERCLTPDVEGTQVSPTWLSGASQFAFIQRIPGRTQVWTRYPDGRSARYVGEVADSAHELRWHPLGALMAYTMTRYSPSRGMVSAVRWLDINTGAQGDLAYGAAEGNPAWSYDGQQLAWARRVSPKPWQIWVAGAKGERPRVLVPRGNGVEPAWSPSGAQLAYASNASGTWEIYMAGLATGLSDRLTESPPGAWCRRPIFSPEGDAILYESNYHPGLAQLQETSGLYLMRLADRSVRLVAPDARSAAWQGGIH
ncbi:MAG TPA: carboxypeptidase regulatory-like domain-containing protein [Pantanalinema sp.]